MSFVVKIFRVGVGWTRELEGVGKRPKGWAQREPESGASDVCGISAVRFCTIRSFFVTHGVAVFLFSEWQFLHIRPPKSWFSRRWKVSCTTILRVVKQTATRGHCSFRLAQRVSSPSIIKFPPSVTVDICWHRIENSPAGRSNFRLLTAGFSAFVSARRSVYGRQPQTEWPCLCIFAASRVQDGGFHQLCWSSHQQRGSSATSVSGGGVFPFFFYTSNNWKERPKKVSVHLWSDWEMRLDWRHL